MKNNIKLFVVICIVAFVVCGFGFNTKDRLEAGTDISKQAGGSSLTVTSTSGMILREMPDVKGKKICSVPFGEKVEKLAEQGDVILLAGAFGKWTRVKWADKTGWMFGGHLQVLDLQSLKDTAAKVYSGIYREDARQMHADSKKKYADNIYKLSNLTSKDMSIVSILNNVAIIEYTGVNLGPGGYIEEWLEPGKLKGVWYASNNLWKEIPLSYHYVSDTILVNLNRDQLTDIVMIDSESGEPRIYVGTIDGVSKNELDLSSILGQRESPRPMMSVKSCGNCDAFVIEFDGNLFKFDCSKNKFIPKK